MTPEERAGLVNVEFLKSLVRTGTVDAADFRRLVGGAIRDAVAAERERVAAEVESMAGASKVGPSHALGWNSACRTIARRIREARSG